MDMKKFFLEKVTPNTKWPIYPEAICGFSESEVAIYCDVLGIEAHGDLRRFFLTFGRCSGGVFIWDPFLLYMENESSLAKVKRSHEEFANFLLEENQLTVQDMLKKPYFFYDDTFGSQAFVYTTDPSLIVWHYHDGLDTVGLYRSENFTFLDLLIEDRSFRDKNSNPLGLEKEEILRRSTCHHLC